MYDNATEFQVEKIDSTHADYEQYDLSHQLITQFRAAITEDEPYSKRLDILIQLNLFTKTCDDPLVKPFEWDIDKKMGTIINKSN